MRISMTQEKPAGKIAHGNKAPKLVIATVLGLSYASYVCDNICNLEELRGQLGSYKARRIDIERDNSYVKRMFDFLIENTASKEIPSPYDGYFFTGFQDYSQKEVPMYGASQGCVPLQQVIDSGNCKLIEINKDIKGLEQKIMDAQVFSLF